MTSMPVDALRRLEAVDLHVASHVLLLEAPEAVAILFALVLLGCILLQVPVVQGTFTPFLNMLNCCDFSKIIWFSKILKSVILI